MQSVKNIFNMSSSDNSTATNMAKYTMNMKPSAYSSHKNKYYEKYNCYITLKDLRSASHILKVIMLWESGMTCKAKMESDLVGSFTNTYEFKRPISFKRYPDIVQNFEFDIWDETTKKVLGRASFSFKTTINQKEFLMSFPIIGKEQNKEIGTVQAFFAKTEKTTRDFIGLEVSGKDLKNVDYDGSGNMSDPFLIFHRTFNDEMFVPIYCSPPILDNLNPKFEKVVLAVSELCEKDANSRIKIECWDWQEDYRNQFIGSTITTLNELSKKPMLQLKGRDERTKTGELIVKASSKLIKPNMGDFLTTEDKFSFMLGVDFSSYNSMPYNKKNLHGLDRTNSNPYLKAIEEVAKIMWGQDSDGKIPCFGFGGRPSFPDFTTDNVHSLIPISGNNRKMSMISPEKLATSYKNALKYIDPSTQVSIIELLKLVRDWATRDMKSNIYYVLVILTAGHIDELQAAIDLLVDIAHLPISIVLVGMGEHDFSALEKLDGDKKWLRNSKKKLVSRDIVHFVDYEECCDNMDKFGKIVLEEFPEQFMSYKLLSGYKVSA